VPLPVAHGLVGASLVAALRPSDELVGWKWVAVISVRQVLTKGSQFEPKPSKWKTDEHKICVHPWQKRV